MMEGTLTLTEASGLIGTIWRIINTPGWAIFQDPALLDFIDAAVPLAAVVMLLFYMLGSQRSTRYLYWTVATYILFKLVVSSL